MPYEDLIVLIPSHSLEDFPADLGDEDAASLLNSFAVAWHPALLAQAKVLPRWNRADSPPDGSQKRLFFLPKSCEGWAPADWTTRAVTEGSFVVRGISDRAEMIAAALAPLDESARSCDPDLAADFLALGFCYLQIELLTRKMRNFSNLDEGHIQREVVAAAEAALVGDAETAKTRLKVCFESLLEARERFYPVDCYLIDLCLVIPRLADDHLRKLLVSTKPASLLASAIDLEEISRTAPELHTLLREACDRGTVDVVCGDLCERPLPMLPLASVIWQLEEANRLTTRLLGRQPAIWGRRRYGVFPLLPQLLKKSDFQGALHTVFDDGIYPDSEHTKFRWEGTGGTSIDSWSRIPLAADASLSYLKFPDRMSESMDHDHVAAVTLARWPEAKSPFFDDLCRMHKYAPVLGRFVTFGEFFERTDHPTRHAAYKPGEYLTPFLFQSVAREENNAISRYTNHLLRRSRFDTAVWLKGMRELLVGGIPDPEPISSLERDLEKLDENPTDEMVQPIEQRIDELYQQTAEQLASLVMSGGGTQPGYLVFNTLPFRRLASVSLPESPHIPASAGENSWMQWTESQRAMTVDVPGSGFVWVAGNGSPSPPVAPQAALASPNFLRNEFFEVHINETTGGIAQIKGFGRSPNRLSQQLVCRFTRERTFSVTSGNHTEEVKSHYAEMRLTNSQITGKGPAFGEIVASGEIVDQTNGAKLAGYRQTVRVWRGRRVVEIDVELDIEKMPDGEPWHNYFTSRFAWHDETASLTRSVMLGASETAEERLESLHYLEIATPEERTTIVSPGFPYYRKCGPRMVDAILVVQRESRRHFRFVVAVDQDFPMQAALDEQVPAVVVLTTNGPPRSGSVGWFFHLSTRQVQLVQMLPVLSEPVAADSETGATAKSAEVLRTGCGVGLRLVETEGRPIRARLRCFRTPTRARQRDLNGKTICELSLDGDAVLVDMNSFEVADVEIHFS